MTAVGFALFAFGALFSLVVEIDRHRWDVRDLIVTLPFCIGLFLMLAGAVRWLWEVMP